MNPFEHFLRFLIGGQFTTPLDPHKTMEIFVPGGHPEYTYVNRVAHGLETSILSAKENLCKLVTVTGPTKSGKSVLTKRIYSENESIWVDGGAIAGEDDFWSFILEKLDEYPTHARSQHDSHESGYSGEVSFEAGLPVLGKAGAKGGSSKKNIGAKGQNHSRTVTFRSKAVTTLALRRVPLIIDDFHYLPIELQGSIIRALKAPISNGLPCIILAIPHRRYDAILVEREMTGRVHSVTIPDWTTEELRSIPQKGLPLLNLYTDNSTINFFLEEALGSPHLVQEFFRELCLSAGHRETAKSRTKITPSPSAQKLLARVATELSRPVFETLAKGPQSRSDRLQRKFKDGREGDIYVAVLNAIVLLKPSRRPIEYEEIRSKLKDLLAEEPPQANEVTRVLEQMGKIQVSAGASAPVLDYDKNSRRLHITDPYFAFFLKWGTELVLDERFGISGKT